MRVNYPNLLIIGAMKCGTTSLHDYLNQHPDIFMSQPKEIHYYDSLSRLSKNDYLKYFKTNKKIIGTTPQSYTKAHHKDFKNIPQKIFKDTPDVKLIYIVRDPFERMRSHILEGLYQSPLRFKYTLESGHYWKTSLYYYQINEFMKYFSKKQIHVLTLESLKNHRLEEMNKIFRFLNVDEINDSSIFDYMKNDADSKTLPVELKKQLWYRVGQRLLPHYTERKAVSIVKKKYINLLKKPDLSEIISESIINIIKKDAMQFQNEFNLDISMWNLMLNYK